MTDINRVNKLVQERCKTTLERIASVDFEYIGFTINPFIQVYGNDKAYLFYDPINDRVMRSQLK